MIIRPATDRDREAIWAVLEPMIRKGETYALPRDWGRDETLAYWFSPENEVLLCEEAGEVLGTYVLRANQKGGGSHVANCGYVTREGAEGRGIARAMCLDSLDRAARKGFRAMQFNFVVATNERAVRLWTNLGFRTVGTLPGAFRHPESGYVDALVMYRELP